MMVLPGTLPTTSSIYIRRQDGEFVHCTQCRELVTNGSNHWIYQQLCIHNCNVYGTALQHHHFIECLIEYDLTKARCL